MGRDYLGQTVQQITCQKKSCETLFSKQAIGKQGAMSDIGNTGITSLKNLDLNLYGQKCSINAI